LKTAKQNLRIQKWVAAISVILLAVKFIAYYFTHSVSILTDALESIVNVVAGFIGLYSLYVAAKPRDADHPYGHGKAEFISAAVEGTLICIAGVAILYKAVLQYFYPVDLQKIDFGILLIAVTAVVNYIVGYWSERTGKQNNSLALLASGRHLQSDTFSTLGIIAGLVLLYFTGLKWIDSAVAFLFSFYIIYTGYTIVRRSIAGIMDEADAQLLQEIVQLLEANRRENWVDLHNFRVIKYGSVLHVDCHLTVPWYLNVNEAHIEIEALASLIRRKYGEAVELFVHSDGCRYFQCPICSKEDCPVREHTFEKRIPWTLANVSKDKKHSLQET
jgi:cation diffusion facilitator family transporter